MGGLRPPLSSSHLDKYNYYDVGLVYALTTPAPPPGYRDRTEHLPDETVVIEEDNESLFYEESKSNDRNKHEHSSR